MKRAMTNDEKMLVDALVAHGCVICGQPAQFHHLPGARPNALAIGYPLCMEHHTGQEYHGQSIHNGNQEFCAKYGSELELHQQALIKAFKRSVPF